MAGDVTTKAKSWLNSKNITACPLCKGMLTPKDQTGILTPTKDGKALSSLPLMAAVELVSVVCDDCGHVLLFAAGRMGI